MRGDCHLSGIICRALSPAHYLPRMYRGDHRTDIFSLSCIPVTEKVSRQISYKSLFYDTGVAAVSNRVHGVTASNQGWNAADWDILLSEGGDLPLRGHGCRPESRPPATSTRRYNPCP